MLALLLGARTQGGVRPSRDQERRYQLQAGPKLRRIEGQTLGIVGLDIGRRFAEKAHGIGLKVIATSRSRSITIPRVEFVALDELLTRSDYVSLHVPMTPETKRMLGAAQLAQMKPDAYLINTARGGLIDHDALPRALEKANSPAPPLTSRTPNPRIFRSPP